MKSIITSAIRKGPRPYQENRFVVCPIKNGPQIGELLAVMDGHGDGTAAELCSQRISDFRVFDLEVKDALKVIVRELDSATKDLRGGTTLSIAFVADFPRVAHVAIIGDSPVVILDSSGKLHVSPEHNVRTNLAERKGAEKRGGVYSYGYIWNHYGSHGLQMSRALGNADLGNIISKKPEIYTVDAPVWVLVASDGLFDPGHGDTISLLEEIKEYAALKASADMLMKWAEKRGLEDNATALVWCPAE